MKNTGGPAFPRPIGWNGLGHHEEHAANDGCEGMSLRDYFAANVITALYPDRIDRLTAPNEPMNDEVDDKNEYIVPGEVLAQRIAKAAYMVADAMLEERKK